MSREIHARPSRPSENETPYREVRACDAGIATTTIVDNNRWLVRKEDRTGGYILTDKRHGQSVYIQPGDNANEFLEGLDAALGNVRAYILDYYLSPYFD